MRARGLKQELELCGSKPQVSRPMRARGLKPRYYRFRVQILWSRPMRARGLKLRLIVLIIVLMSRAPCGRVG